MKILIVDDEPLISEKIRNMIADSHLKTHTVQCISDSQEALELIKTDPPQILLSDIRMPHISGVDLAQYIHRNNLDILVIFITGYSDFEYAKSAIKYQVFDYLLKPLDAEQTIRNINNAVSAVLEKQKHQEMYHIFQDYFSSHYNSARRQFLERLLFHPLTHSNEKLLALQKQFHMEAAGFCLCAVTFSFDSEFGEEEFYYTYMIEQYINRKFPAFPTYPFGNTIYILCLFQENEVSNTALCGKVNAVSQLLEAEYSLTIYVGISSVSNTLSKIQMLRRQTSQCLDYIQSQVTSNIIMFNDLPEYCLNQDYFNIIDSITALIRVLRSGNKQGALTEIDKLINNISCRPKSYICDMIDLVVSNTVLFLYDLSIPTTELEKIQSNILVPLNAQSDVRLRLDYLSYWLKYLADYISETQSKEQTHLIQIVYDYIEQNYSQPIGLTSLSEYVDRNPSYLSRLIKQQTNKNFSLIITERRIEEAKKLLRNTALKIPQIAERVGYPNVRYFIRVFNAHVTMSPSDYRKITSAFFDPKSKK